MNPLLWLFIAVEFVLGIGSTIYVLAALFVTLGYKFYRKIKFHEALF